MLFLGALLAALGKAGTVAGKGALAAGKGAAAGGKGIGALLGQGGAPGGKGAFDLGKSFGGQLVGGAGGGSPLLGPATPSVSGAIDLQSLSPGQAGLLQSAIPNAGSSGGGALANLAAPAQGRLAELLGGLLGPQGSFRRDLAKTGLQGLGTQGDGGGGGGPGPGASPAPPVAPANIPPPAYAPQGSAGFGNAGTSLAPLVPQPGADAALGDTAQRILALQLASRLLGNQDGGGGQGAFFPGLQGIV